MGPLLRRRTYPLPDEHRTMLQWTRWTSTAMALVCAGQVVDRTLNDRDTWLTVLYLCLCIGSAAASVLHVVVLRRDTRARERARDRVHADRTGQPGAQPPGGKPGGDRPS